VDRELVMKLVMWLGVTTPAAANLEQPNTVSQEVLHQTKDEWNGTVSEEVTGADLVFK